MFTNFYRFRTQTSSTSIYATEWFWNYQNGPRTLVLGRDGAILVSQMKIVISLSLASPNTSISVLAVYQVLLACQVPFATSALLLRFLIIRFHHIIYCIMYSSNVLWAYTCSPVVHV